MKLVQFHNRAFGVRVRGGFLFMQYRYIDFVTPGLKWPASSQFFRNCQTTEEIARAYIYQRRAKLCEVVKL